MIVKILRQGQWTLIDGVERLSHEIVYKSGDKEFGVQEAVLDLRTHTTPPEPEEVGGAGKTASSLTTGDGEFCELWLTLRGKETPQQVLADFPIYLLNNEGKTIEKL